MACVPEFFEVGVPEGLFGSDSLLWVVLTHLVNQFNRLPTHVRQHLLYASTLLRGKVKVHSSSFAATKYDE